MTLRIGIGYDAHRLEAGSSLILGGVRVPHDRGLVGHSDADVLAHAVADALLGALGLGDLGSRFPSSDERWKGADSLDLLRRVAAEVGEHGGRVTCVDSVIVAQQPRLSPHAEAMRRNLAGALGVEPGLVGVKSKTTDRLGFEGRAEGISAQAVALVEVAEGR
ncbi:MAG: 2-C-methyl-D-erythritol 2,4-cyclodiphosphate synthase [Acidobacteriota bacterium]|nr:2-C-methyl-D-erythritol 2,4-cyclodiphosphate synthase [Acidobacteriota bacterium]